MYKAIQKGVLKLHCKYDRRADGPPWGNALKVCAWKYYGTTSYIHEALYWNVSCCFATYNKPSWRFQPFWRNMLVKLKKCSKPPTRNQFSSSPGEKKRRHPHEKHPAKVQWKRITSSPNLLPWEYSIQSQRRRTCWRVDGWTYPPKKIRSY